MPSLVDLTGQRFGRLTVQQMMPERSKHGLLWLCACDCGEKTVVAAHNLRNGNATSCRVCPVVPVAVAPVAPVAVALLRPVVAPVAPVAVAPVVPVAPVVSWMNFYKTLIQRSVHFGR
jgi:hypothetical protein